MKTWILAMVMMVGMAMSAQPGDRKFDDVRGHGKERRENFTPEQRTELKVKKLTLDLDLSDKQQKDLQKLFLAAETQKAQLMAQHKADREAGKKLADDEKFALKAKRLDNQIALKREVKKILSAEQYASFEKAKDEKRGNVTKEHKKLNSLGLKG